MLRIELKEDSPGYAQLNARRWKGSNNVEFAIQRNQDSHYFLGNDNWGPEPVWHKVPDLTVVGDALQGRIGPWLIDGLINQSGNMRFLLQIRDGNVEDNGPLNFIGNILASSAGGDSSRTESVKKITETTAETPAITEPTISEPIEIAEENSPVIPEEIIPETSTPPVKKSKTGLIIALVILLLAIVGAAAYFLLMDKTTQATASTTTSECSVANSSDELAFVQTCLKTKPDSKTLLTIIAEAKAAKKCGIAQRLYANQAQGGNVEIAIAYAKEYVNGSDCFAVDKDNAIYWYETALSIDPNNETAKKGLAELKK